MADINAAAAAGAEDIETLERFRPTSFRDRLELFGKLDPHFAALWLAYSGGLYRAVELDGRTRLLVLVGQYTMLGNASGLTDTLHAAIAERIDLKEVLEVILQTWVYAGEQTVSDGVELFVDVVGEAGLLDDVAARGLPVDATTSGRSLEAERETWSEADRADPRLERLIETYGWMGLSTGVRLRPGYHIGSVAALDAVDQRFAKLWEDALYQGMYARGVLDDRTRLLCMVGNCLAVGQPYQTPRHMRGALRVGATPREVLAVICQTVAVVGHPHMMIGGATSDFIKVLDEEGRLAELVDEDKVETLREVVSKRVASRSGVTE